ncbi:hypothetical protein LTR91_021205 [Friedmanniomyces endolithicus]|uniref:FAD/NAD(P)-binding domain-containing protein n=1 Tax=Friedmanniomyces endolithicus TaxID=329885 RepID=A0AAN6HAM2_9PEZI|nr:hypothetical protein LTR91_021205 [Friedmanniomyces endolithicus]
MGKPQRTAAVKFDDIPGKLPRGKVPEDTDRTSVANNAVDRLNNLQLDDLHDDAIWRDLLSFTGTYRTFYSQKTVFATLQKLSKEKQRSRFTLEGIEPRIGRTVDGTFWLDIDASCSTFENSIVVLCEDGEWRIWMLRTWLESFEGHGHPDVLEPVMAVSNGAGHEPADTCANGASDSSAMNGHGATTDYDAIVVGGGQAGLSTAGRLKALGIRYILLERRPEIGDVWNTRYESLRWHTSKHYGSLPFGHTYPEEDDYMLPAKRIGAGHRAWAEKFGINVQTGTAVESASWDESQTRWTVTVSSTAGKQTLTARNLVLSIGVGHLTPVLPDWATPSQVSASNFHGTVLHGSQYKSCAAFAGKPGLVVGTANTAHDVAEDMANADMSPTMIQRGSTFVFPAEWLHRAEDVHYHPAMDPISNDVRKLHIGVLVVVSLARRAPSGVSHNSPWGPRGVNLDDSAQGVVIPPDTTGLRRQYALLFRRQNLSVEIPRPALPRHDRAPLRLLDYHLPDLLPNLALLDRKVRFSNTDEDRAVGIQAAEVNEGGDGCEQDIDAANHEYVLEGVGLDGAVDHAGGGDEEHAEGEDVEEGVSRAVEDAEEGDAEGQYASSS